MRTFLATRLVTAFVAALVLGTVVDRLALLAVAALGQGSGIGNALFLLVALIGFFVALPIVLMVLHFSVRPTCPPLWQALCSAFLACWVGALWVSAEFGHVSPGLLGVISAHAFVIYGIPVALLFRLSTQGAPRLSGPGPTAMLPLIASPAILTLPTILLAWEGFSRGVLMPNVLGQ